MRLLWLLGCSLGLLFTFGVLGCAATAPPPAAAPSGGAASDDLSPEVERCLAGDDAICLALGRKIISRHAPSLRENTIGQRAFSTACERKNQVACAELGRAQLEGRLGLTQDLAAALTTLRATCAAGAPRGCAWLSMLLEARPDLRLPDEDLAVISQKAWGMLDSACTAGDGQSCADYGSLVIRGQAGAPTDLVRGRLLLEKACQMGAAGGCNELAGFLAERASPSASELADARALVMRSCQLDDADGCRVLAIMDIRGMAAKADADGGERQLADNCNRRRDPESCVALGTSILGRSASDAQNAKVLAAFDTACTLGHAAGCVAAFALIMSQVPPDEAKAAGYARAGCSRSDAASCNNLAVFTAEGRGDIVKDLDTARRLFQLACELKDQQACDNLRVY